MVQKHLRVAEKVMRRFSQLADVHAIAIGGSQTSGLADEDSDVDLYIFSITEIPSQVRTAIATELGNTVEINDFWGSGNEWRDREMGVHVDAMFWTTEWTDDQINRVMVRHEAEMGYTTSFLYTISTSQILFDRHGWLAQLKKEAAQEYPEPLANAIVARNYPVLRQISSSYLRQLEKAASRHDSVSLNHRTAALLASYFDILFAINRVPHPGEKRLLDQAERLCLKRSANMRAEINAVLDAVAINNGEIGIAVNQLIDSLDRILQAEGFLT